jgi:hypothetical protein
MAEKHLRCISCNTFLSPWGKTNAGHKRYYCRTCKQSRTFFRKNLPRPDIFVLFKQYVLWGFTYEILASLSNYSIQHLHEKFYEYLKTTPPPLPVIDQSAFDETFLLLDGLWLKRGFVLMAYRQSGTLTILHISVVGREAATKIAKDLKVILSLGLHFTGIVSDGGTGIVGAVQRVFPNTPHQICLAHLHRNVISAIGRYSKQERIKQLQGLADHVWLIESKDALEWWKTEVAMWIKNNTDYLKEKKYDLEYNSWYVHTGARRAVSILLELPYTSFHFLDHPHMPKTTNELEAQFGHLGKRWLAHRGLKTEKWEYFMRWFVYFYNEDVSHRKTKEA